LKDQVGVDIHQYPVLEGTGLHLIGVGHHVAWEASLCRNPGPLAAGGVAGPAAAPEAGVHHQLPDLFRSPVLQGVHERLVAAAPPVLVQGGGPLRLAVLKEHFFEHGGLAPHHLQITISRCSVSRLSRTSSIPSGVRGPYILPLISIAGARSQKPMQAVGSTVNRPSSEISPAPTPSF